MTIRLRADKIKQYKTLHAAVWPEVLAILQRHHVRNYSIFLHEQQLFAYLEYHGNDFAHDMQAVANEKVTQRWWQLTEPCQQPLPSRQQGQWWSMMEEVFHLD